MRASTFRRLLPAAFALGAAFLAGLESPLLAQHSNGCTKTLGRRSGARTIVQEIPNSFLPPSLRTSESTSSSGPVATIGQSSGSGIVLAPVGGGPGMAVQQGGGPAPIQSTRVNWRRMVGRYEAVSRLESGCPGGGKYQTTQILGEVGGPLHPYAHYFRALTSGKKGSAVPLVVAGMYGEDLVFAKGRPSAACHFPGYRVRELGRDYEDRNDGPPYIHDIGGLYVALNDVPFKDDMGDDFVISGVTVRIMAAFYAKQKGLLSTGTANSSAMALASFETRVNGAMLASIRINTQSVNIVGTADIHGVKVQGQCTVRTDDVVLAEGSIEVKPTWWSIERRAPGVPHKRLSKSFNGPGYTAPLFISLGVSPPASIGAN